jgi:hypothetical protein
VVFNCGKVDNELSANFYENTELNLKILHEILFKKKAFKQQPMALKIYAKAKQPLTLKNFYQ